MCPLCTNLFSSPQFPAVPEELRPGVVLPLYQLVVQYYLHPLYGRSTGILYVPSGHFLGTCSCLAWTGEAWGVRHALAYLRVSGLLASFFRKKNPATPGLFSGKFSGKKLSFLLL